MSLIRELLSVSLANTKNKTRLLRSLRCAQARSTSTIRRLHADLRQLIGPRAFNVGTIALSLMAHITRPPRVFLRKRGERVSVISARRLFSRFFPTKICAESTKRSCPSRIPFCCQKFGANAQHRPKISREPSRPLLHHSPTPSPTRSPTL